MLYLALALVVVGGLFGLLGGYVIARHEGEGGVARLGFTALGGFVGGFVGVLLAIAPFTYAQTRYNERTVEATVLDKDRTAEGDMRVYTDKGVFLNADSTWRGKHNSADWWGQWQEGETYRFDVAGWRLGFTSDFPNIFDWEPVK